MEKFRYGSIFCLAITNHVFSLKFEIKKNAISHDDMAFFMKYYSVTTIAVQAEPASLVF